MFLFIYLFMYFCIKPQERLIKIQLAHMSKSYLKFRHVTELSHSVHWGINALHPFPQKHPHIFCLVSCKLSKPFF